MEGQVALELGLTRLTVRRHGRRDETPVEQMVAKKGCGAGPKLSFSATAEPKAGSSCRCGGSRWTAAVTIAAQVGLGDAE